jgi:hypothetical protein
VIKRLHIFPAAGITPATLAELRCTIYRPGVRGLVIGYSEADYWQSYRSPGCEHQVLMRALVLMTADEANRVFS